MTAPSASRRRAAILAEIEARGFVTLEALAESFSVSMQTVRRDVIALQAKGLIERFHGGAGARGRIDFNRLEHTAKRALKIEEKAEIARQAVARLEAGSFVYIDVGTTMEAVAAALDASLRLTVITNSLHVAARIDPGQHDIRLLPGRVGGADGSLVGEDTVLALRAMRLDMALIGCSAVEPDGHVMDFDPGKIAIKRTAMSVARSSLLLATRDKFARFARLELAHRTDFAAVLTEAGCSSESDCSSDAV
ncbi:MAG TPA: DeoR/GlpR family DNA-binding transcription regulator [Kiloniellales bacterium]|nr:DeoR/GlpR family DNA-binding transcription regulator [Kiloniellales bacterium]